ncbi:MAG: long-chain fatty acid--CoA ligase [Rhodothermales bacterium]|nr:long-chain fatty acid--CoA ligase [Rhodothermales bacterium]MBO6778925.1 long-chain fatty acid--CoA ligase [Rhodothermales bacterium]
MPAVVSFETVPQLFDGLFDRYEGQSRPALSYYDRPAGQWIDIDWDGFRGQVRAMAGYLYSVGVRPGDRVAILSENRPEWAVTDLATQYLGAINVSLYTSLPASQAGYIVKDSAAKVFVVSTGIQLKKAEAIFDDCPDLDTIVTMSEMRKEHPGYVHAWADCMEAGATAWEAHEDEIRAFGKAVTPSDISALIYTSGTTGNPKGVRLSHENFCTNAQAALSRVPFDETDHHLSFLPLCHSFERMAGYLCVLACGARITYAQSIDTVNRDLMTVKPTVMISVPRLFERVYNVIAKSVEEGSSIKKKIFYWSVDAGKAYAHAMTNGGAGMVTQWKKGVADKLVFSKLHEKLGGNLRFAVSGGAALPAAVGEFFQAAGVTIIEGYGLTETSPVLTINPIAGPRYGTVGHVIDRVTVGIMNLESGEIMAQISGEDYPTSLSSEPGEIVAKGPNIMQGYWQNDQATRESIDDNGWYHTGDVGRFENGYLRITDRIKHMIVSKGGKNIYPGPIEELFKTEPLIDQIMVVGEGREFLTALVVPSEDAVSLAGGEEELQTALKAAFRSYSREAAAPEKIRDFRLVSEAFSVDNGMMTPTLKLRRKAIEAHHAGLIDEMYAAVV